MKKHIFSILPLLLCGTLLIGCGGTASDAENGETAADTQPTGTAVQSTEPVTEAVPTDPNLLFEDNFDGDTLDDDKWERCPEWERQGGLDVWDNEMSFLDGEGHLILRAEWDADAARVKSGAVRTNGCFSSGYGYYEASIKFPYAPGTWGAFWMMCGRQLPTDGVPSGQSHDVRGRKLRLRWPRECRQRLPRHLLLPQEHGYYGPHDR